jgi:predicted nucleic acid-binding protein
LRILVDTSVWIDHLRRTSPHLVDLLDQGAVLVHPFVVGELACGNLRNRTEILGLLQALPATPVAEPEETLHFVENEQLHGRGLGWVDVNLLASARLQGAGLWSLDKTLAAAARRLRIDGL